MRRLVVAISMLVAVACDSEGMDEGLTASVDGAMEVDGLVDQARPSATPETGTLTVRSFTDGNGNIGTEFTCDNSVGSSDCDAFCDTEEIDCVCDLDSCTVCTTPSLQNDDTCDFSGAGLQSIQLIFESGPIYAYVDSDGNRRWIDEVESPWTLSACESSQDNCDCDGVDGCGCALGYLDFSVTMPDGSGANTTTAAVPDPKVQLTTGSCGN